MCKIETSIDKDKIITNEFIVRGRENEKDYIKYYDTFDENKLKGKEEIIIKFKI